MPKDLDVWKFHEGRVYDSAELKEAYVVPLVESLDLPGQHPFVIDVGSGTFSVAEMLSSPWRRFLHVVNIDIAIPSDSPFVRLSNCKVDIDELIDGNLPETEQLIAQRLSRVGKKGTNGADAVVFSEILNYVDFKKTLSWFDKLLKIGGYFVVANLPTRGYQKLFSEQGVQSNGELIHFCTEQLGYELSREEYPWGREYEEEEFLLAAFKKAA